MEARDGIGALGCPGVSARDHNARTVKESTSGAKRSPQSSPFEVAVAALFVIVFVRTNGTYWFGRALAAGYGKTRLGKRWNPARLDGARRSGASPRSS